MPHVVVNSEGMILDYLDTCVVQAGDECLAISLVVSHSINTQEHIILHSGYCVYPFPGVVQLLHVLLLGHTWLVQLKDPVMTTLPSTKANLWCINPLCFRDTTLISASHNLDTLSSILI